MVFSSPIFIFAFLPIFLLLYYLVPTTYRNLIGLIGSYVFYAWGEPIFSVILFGSTYIDYRLGLLLGRCVHHRTRKSILITSLIINLGLLGFYKYANFIILDVWGLMNSDSDVIAQWSIVGLPIGISFFTFQKISYIIDIYRRKVEHSRRFLDFALYVAFFPQLIAGPIVRYHDIYKQLSKRSCSMPMFTSGIVRFSLGLGKKVLIANPLAYVADSILEQPIESIPVHYLWLAILCYSFQILFDFSGYSDMAIGLAKMMGFQLLENFNRPYTAKTVSEFWRRWHISLSNWMLEYLYIPLGGNKVRRWRLYFNLWLVFVLSGIWHGASWSFLLWGTYHGVFLSIERFLSKRNHIKIPPFLAVPGTFFIIMMGWVLFRVESVTEAFRVYFKLFDLTSYGSQYPKLPIYDIVDNRFWVVFLAAFFIAFNPFGKRAATREFVSNNAMPKIPVIIVSFLVLIVSFSSISNSSYNPFIYFRF